MKLQPLNLIILGQTKSDYINRMITMTEDFYLVTFSKWDFSTKQLMTLTSDFIELLSLCLYKHGHLAFSGHGLVFFQIKFLCLQGNS